MKTCVGCISADWKKNAKGALHRSGDGLCSYEYALPPLPQAMYWVGISPPRPSGGAINRRTNMPDHCVYWKGA